MGKLIAVWGAPNSGKTVLSVKLAEAIYSRSRGKSAVIVVFTDIVTPTLPVVFPNFRSEDIYSIGSVLSKPDFFADDVVSNIVMTKNRMNLGYMGYKDGENRHSYPEYTEMKTRHFYDVLVGIAQTEAKKSSVLYMKCRCLDEVTGGKSVIFATGTPISNSMLSFILCRDICSTTNRNTVDWLLLTPRLRPLGRQLRQSSLPRRAIL